MKRFLFALFTVLAAAVVCSVSAFADNTQNTVASGMTKVYYHLIDHNKVELKWSKVANAENYYIYKYDEKNGGYIYTGKTKKLKYTLKKLSPDTEYTFAVTTEKITDGSTYGNGCTVTFTTPEEWYYFVDSESFTDEINYYSHRYVYRQHYDGSGRENFDIYKLISEYENFEKYPDSGYSYGVDSIEQHFGYVYIKTTYYDIIDASEYDYFRMTNDGTKIVSFGGSSYSGNKQYHYSADKAFCGSSTHFDGGMAACLTDSSVWVEFLSGDKATYGMVLRKPMSNISNFVSDDKYAYFIASPYLKENNTEDEEKVAPESSASVYRVTLEDPTEEQVKNRTETGELIASFDYNFTDDGVTLLGCNNGYLYFIIREEGQSGKMCKYGFYRLSLSGENNKVEKLGTKKMYRISHIELKGDTVWFLGYSSKENANAKKFSAYCIDITSEKPVIKRFFTKTTEGVLYSFEYYNLQGEQHIEITDDFIYINFRDTYYRVNIAKKTVKSSKKPFVWR